jgi:hypothetical protein
VVRRRGRLRHWATVPPFQDNFLYTHFEYDALTRMTAAATLLSPLQPE